MLRGVPATASAQLSIGRRNHSRAKKLVFVTGREWHGLRRHQWRLHGIIIWGGSMVVVRRRGRVSSPWILQGIGKGTLHQLERTKPLRIQSNNRHNKKILRGKPTIGLKIISQLFQSVFPEMVPHARAANHPTIHSVRRTYPILAMPCRTSIIRNVSVDDKRHPKPTIGCIYGASTERSVR